MGAMQMSGKLVWVDAEFSEEQVHALFQLSIERDVSVGQLVREAVEAGLSDSTAQPVASIETAPPHWMW